MARPQQLQPTNAEHDCVLADLFPLRLSPFERFFLWDERPPHPATSFTELHFATPLNLELLAKSIHVAIHRNPLLACRVAEHDGQLMWDYDPGFCPVILQEPAHVPLSERGWPTPIDLQSETSLRFWYRERNGQSRLLIQLHHACADGIGLRRFLIDALTGYANETRSAAGDQPTVAWQPLELAGLRDRFDFSRTFSRPASRPLSTWQRIKNAHYFHFQLPQPILGHAHEHTKADTTDVSEPLRHQLLDRQLSSHIKERAKSEKVGINELALSLLFQTCCRWNQELGDTNPQSRLRLLMPYDLRSRPDLRLPATNRFSFSFLGRTHAECQHLPDLLRSVRDEIEWMRDSHLPLDFLESLKMADRAPNLVRWIMNRSRRMATAVLTYTGDISRGMHKLFPDDQGARVIGDARLTNVLGAPPVRQHTNLSLGLCINWGQLCISAAWNREALTAQDCERFLAKYAAAWQAWSMGDER